MNFWSQQLVVQLNHVLEVARNKLRGKKMEPPGDLRGFFLETGEDGF